MQLPFLISPILSTYSNIFLATYFIFWNLKKLSNQLCSNLKLISCSTRSDLLSRKVKVSKRWVKLQLPASLVGLKPKEMKTWNPMMKENGRKLQVILFEIDCAILYTNLHELFCQFISWTNWVNSGKFIAEYHVKLWLIWKKFTTIS